MILKKKLIKELLLTIINYNINKTNNILNGNDNNTSLLI